MWINVVVDDCSEKKKIIIGLRGLVVSNKLKKLKFIEFEKIMLNRKKEFILPHNYFKNFENYLLPFGKVNL